MQFIVVKEAKPKP